MKNLDTLQKNKAEILQRINQAVKDGDEAKFAEAFTEFAEMLQESVMSEARGMVQAADNSVLMGRGVRALTSSETKYYEGVIEAMRSKVPQQALTLIDNVLPKTVIDAVFEDIREAHPLLSEINFQNTGILTEIVVSTADGRFMATWGQLCSTIAKELAGGFTTVDLTQKKLSAFIPVCKAMLEVGPEWLDRYVRGILAEAIANGLESGIINGNGLNEPIGMRRNPAGALDPSTGYPALTAIPVTSLTPESYGGIISGLAQGRNGLFRPVTEVLLVVNPVDYFTRILPAVTVRAADGLYVEKFPFPTKVIQSVHVTQGEAIIGLGKQYFFGLGTGSEGRIEYSDHVNFLEDERVYLTKLYGNGRPVDNNSFKLLDISGLTPTAPVVRVADYVDARLSAIGLKNEKNQAVNIGTFNENVHLYNGAIADASVAGDNDTASLTVTAKDANATIVVKNGATPVSEAAGAYSLTLTEGPNVITITSTVGGVEQEAYVLVITYTAKP